MEEEVNRTAAEAPIQAGEKDPLQTVAKLGDFSGVGGAGAAGGTGSVEPGVPRNAAEIEVPADPGTFEMSEVEEKPSLTNAADIARAVSRNYPPLLRDAGVTGQVTLRFRIQSDGRVDALSVTVEDSTHDAFSDAAKRVAERMRFRPARVAGEAVASWETRPLIFHIRGNG